MCHKHINSSQLTESNSLKINKQKFSIYYNLASTLEALQIFIKLNDASLDLSSLDLSSLDLSSLDHLVECKPKLYIHDEFVT